MKFTESQFETPESVLAFDFTGYELDEDYFNAQEERFANHIAQPKLFEPPKAVEVQTPLW